MPLYEYQCTRWGEKFEVRQPMGEGSQGVTCPKCHAVEPRKLFSSFFSSGSSGESCSSCSSGSCSTCGLP